MAFSLVEDGDVLELTEDRRRRGRLHVSQDLAYQIVEALNAVQERDALRAQCAALTSNVRTLIRKHRDGQPIDQQMYLLGQALIDTEENATHG